MKGKNKNVHAKSTGLQNSGYPICLIYVFFSLEKFDLELRYHNKNIEYIQ